MVSTELVSDKNEFMLQNTLELMGEEIEAFYKNLDPDNHHVRDVFSKLKTMYNENNKLPTDQFELCFRNDFGYCERLERSRSIYKTKIFNSTSTLNEMEPVIFLTCNDDNSIIYVTIKDIYITNFNIEPQSFTLGEEPTPKKRKTQHNEETYMTTLLNSMRSKGTYFELFGVDFNIKEIKNGEMFEKKIHINYYKSYNPKQSLEENWKEYVIENNSEEADVSMIKLNCSDPRIKISATNHKLDSYEQECISVTINISNAGSNMEDNIITNSYLSNLDNIGIPRDFGEEGFYPLHLFNFSFENFSGIEKESTPHHKRYQFLLKENLLNEKKEKNVKTIKHRNISFNLHLWIGEDGEMIRDVRSINISSLVTNSEMYLDSSRPTDVLDPKTSLLLPSRYIIVPSVFEIIEMDIRKIEKDIETMEAKQLKEASHSFDSQLETKKNFLFNLTQQRNTNSDSNFFKPMKFPIGKDKKKLCYSNMEFIRLPVRNNQTLVVFLVIPLFRRENKNNIGLYIIGVNVMSLMTKLRSPGIHYKINSSTSSTHFEDEDNGEFCIVVPNYMKKNIYDILENFKVTGVYLEKKYEKIDIDFEIDFINRIPVLSGERVIMFYKFSKIQKNFTHPIYEEMLSNLNDIKWTAQYTCKKINFKFNIKPVKEILNAKKNIEKRIRIIIKNTNLLNKKNSIRKEKKDKSTD